MRKMLTILATALAALINATGSAAISTVAELRRVTFAGVEAPESFDLVVTALTPTSQSSGSFYIHDNTGFFCIDDRVFPKETKGFEAGDRLHLIGSVEHILDGNSYARAYHIEKIGCADIPPFVDATATEINSGDLLYSPVRFTGIVVDAFRDEADPRYCFLVLTCGHQTVYCSSDGIDDDAVLSRLIDATVSIQGIVYSFRNVGPRAKLGYVISIQGSSDITVIRPAPADPFDVPPLVGNVSDILSFSAKAPLRRKVYGITLAVWHGDRLLLQSADGSLSKIELASKSPPAIGTCIEAIGFPESDFYHLNLSRAIWRKSTPFAVENPPAIPVSARELLIDSQGNRAFQVNYHGRFIRLTGLVCNHPSPDKGERTLQLDDCGFLVPIDFSAAPEALATIAPGSYIEVSGICLMDAENWRPQAPFPHIEGFRLAVRATSDIRILSRPSWWTPKRLLLISGTLLVLLLLWIYLLHTRATIRLGERTRLAIELHDSLSQILTGISMQIDAATRLLAIHPNKCRQRLNVASRSLTSCREELRNCISDLRSHALEESDLQNAVLLTLRPFKEDAQIHVRFHVQRRRLSDNCVHALLRILRELVSNAVRHGAAKTIRIAGTSDKNFLHVSVTDDGNGFDPQTSPGVSEGHFGLQGIAERIHAFKGSFEISSSPGQGTHSTFSFKLL